MVDHLRRLAAALDARPAELAGLLVLLVSGGLAAAFVAFGTLTTTSATGPAVLADAGVPGVASDATTVTVHVAGAVRRPGVVRLASGARVIDAIVAAGGPRSDAVLDALNLAAPVEEAQQVMVPAEAAPGADSSADERADDGRVDLNRATPPELERLPGIGPVLAQRIVRWRDDHGPFEDPGQLRHVPGIGERTFQALADLVRV